MDLQERVRGATEGLADEVLGVLLWGSSLDPDSMTNRSDIDICVVAGPAPPAGPGSELLRWIWRRTPSSLDGRDVDIKVFETLPRFLQGAILDRHVVLWTGDEPALYEYLYPYRRLWEHERHRHQLTREEARELLGGSG